MKYSNKPITFLLIVLTFGAITQAITPFINLVDNPEDFFGKNLHKAGIDLTVHARDIDMQPIQGAELEIYNTTAGKCELIDNQTTNAIGNATFLNAENDTYNISAYYWVNKTRFWINNLTIDLTGFGGSHAYYFHDCNLTTAYINASDNDSNYPRYNILIIIGDSSGMLITSASTSVNGLVSFKLPTDTYNLSVIYHSVSLSFKLNGSVEKYNQTFAISQETNYNISLVFGIFSTYPISSIIDTNFKLTPIFFKIAIGEITSIISNYSAIPSREYTGTLSNVSASIKNITMVENDDFPSNILLNDLRNGLYNLTINATKFYNGDYEVNITANEPHHESQFQVITMRVLETWSTNTEVEEPPLFYPWNNISSFSFVYSCVESPRSGRLLPGGIINELNISVRIDAQFYFYKSLGVAERIAGIWGYSDQGAGEYLVWFNTSVVNVSASTVFKLSPKVELQFYTDGVHNAFPWVYPVYTKLTLSSDKSEIVPVQALNFYLDQSSIITLIYNVSDPLSVINGERIPYANVTYNITLDDVSKTFISNGTVSAVNNTLYPGNYSHTLHANMLGEFIITYTAMRENFSSSAASIQFNVNRRLMDYSFGSNVINYSASTPQDRAISFNITILDFLHHAKLSGALIQFSIRGVTYILIEDVNNAGTYIISINETMLASLEIRTYSFIIEILKENYEEVEIEMFLVVGTPISSNLPDDPPDDIPDDNSLLVVIIIIIATGSIVGLSISIILIKKKKFPKRGTMKNISNKIIIKNHD